MSDQSYQEVTKAPEIEHQKKLARKKNAESKKAKECIQFFTLKDGKVLSVKVKKNGAYTTFVGDKLKWEKREKGSFTKTVQAWKKENLWVSEEDYKLKVEEAKEKLGA